MPLPRTAVLGPCLLVGFWHKPTTSALQRLRLLGFADVTRPWALTRCSRFDFYEFTALVQPLLLEPLRDEAGDLRDVRIRHWIVCVSGDADLRQNHIPDVAAVFVGCLRKQLVLLKEDAPRFLRGPGVGRVKRLGDVVAPDQQDRMLGELEKFRQRDFSPAGTRTPSARGMGGGSSPCGKTGAALGSQPI